MSLFIVSTSNGNAVQYVHRHDEMSVSSNMRVRVSTAEQVDECSEWGGEQQDQPSNLPSALAWRVVYRRRRRHTLKQPMVIVGGHVSHIGG